MQCIITCKEKRCQHSNCRADLMAITVPSKAILISWCYPFESDGLPAETRRRRSLNLLALLLETRLGLGIWEQLIENFDTPLFWEYKNKRKIWQTECHSPPSSCITLRTHTVSLSSKLTMVGTTMSREFSKLTQNTCCVLDFFFFILISILTTLGH